MAKKIYLYNDEGVGEFSAFSVQQYFKGDDMSLMHAEQIIQDGIPSDIDLFVIPGGADRPYHKKLQGAGNAAIRRYVDNGGTYLGICAGGYYGCEKIEFQKNTNGEICEDRELGFFKGTAIGCLPAIAPSYDQTLKSAAITRIVGAEQHHDVLYWGGCYFSAQGDESLKVVARYEEIDGQPPAIISCDVGQGKAILSGVHFEVTREALLNYNFEFAEDNKRKISLRENLPNIQFKMEDYL